MTRQRHRSWLTSFPITQWAIFALQVCSLCPKLGEMMLTSYSLDGLLECLRSEDSKRIRAHQFLHATLLHLWPSATNEHSLHFLRTYTHCFEDFCGYWSFGLLAQWLGRVFRSSGPKYNGEGINWCGIWGSGKLQRLDLWRVFGV